MKLRTQILFFAFLPTLIFTALAAPAQAQSETLTGTFPIPAATSAATLTATESTPVTSTANADDASSGLADERLRAAAGAPVLSITDVIALALQQNPQRAAAWASVEAARARIGTAKSQGGPQVNLSGDATTQRSFGFPSVSTSTGGTGTGGTGTGGSGTGGIGSGSSGSGSSNRGFINNQSLSVSATIPVYSGGRVKAGKRVAEYSAQAQYAQARSVEQDLIYNTAISYLNVLRGEQLLEVGNANLSVARERRRIAGVRFDAGAAAKLEVLRAETDLANARQTRISSSNALGQSLAALNTLMGRLPETPLRVEPIINLTLPAPLFTTSAGTSTLVADAAAKTNGIGLVTAAPSSQLQLAAGQGRQSLAATQAQIRAAEASVDLAKAAKKPSIGVDILGLLRNPVSFAGRFLLSIGANVAQNLFDSGRTSSQVREAQAVVRQLRAQYSGQELAVANEIEQSLLLLDSAQKRLASADAGVLAAREALRAAQLGYSAGASTSLEVSDAQASLLSAETDAVNARFDVAASQAQLSAAVGVYPAQAIDAYQSVLAVEKNRKNGSEDLKNAQYPSIKR